MTIGHPGVVQAMVFGALAVSLTAVIGVGLGGVIRHTAEAATTLSMRARYSRCASGHARRPLRTTNA